MSIIMCMSGVDVCGMCVRTDAVTRLQTQSQYHMTNQQFPTHPPPIHHRIHSPTSPSHPIPYPSHPPFRRRTERRPHWPPTPPRAPNTRRKSHSKSMHRNRSTNTFTRILSHDTLFSLLMLRCPICFAFHVFSCPSSPSFHRRTHFNISIPLYLFASSAISLPFPLVILFSSLFSLAHTTSLEQRLRTAHSSATAALTAAHDAALSSLHTQVRWFRCGQQTAANIHRDKCNITIIFLKQRSQYSGRGSTKKLILIIAT